MPNNKTTPAQCAKQLRAIISANQLERGGTNATWQMIFTDSDPRNHPHAHPPWQPSTASWQSAVAAFLVQRGQSSYFYMSAGGDRESGGWNEALELDYGEPVGVAIEIPGKDMVFSREWTKATATFDCNVRAGEINMK